MEKHAFLELPYCPNCARSMQLTCSWPRRGGLPELNTYECRRCKIVFTEVATGDAPIPERASALHLEPYHAQH